MSNPKMGFTIEDPREKILWLKYKAFEMGISPREFDMNNFQDIADMVEIKQALDDKQERELKIAKALSEMK